MVLARGLCKRIFENYDFLSGGFFRFFHSRAPAPGFKKLLKTENFSINYSNFKIFVSPKKNKNQKMKMKRQIKMIILEIITITITITTTIIIMKILITIIILKSIQ